MRSRGDYRYDKYVLVSVGHRRHLRLGNRYIIERLPSLIRNMKEAQGISRYVLRCDIIDEVLCRPNLHSSVDEIRRPKKSFGKVCRTEYVRNVSGTFRLSLTE